MLTLQQVSAKYQTLCVYFTYFSLGDNDPVMAYLAACTLSSQTTNAILEVQSGTLIPSPAQLQSQPWQLWTPEINGSSDLISLVR